MFTFHFFAKKLHYVLLHLLPPSPTYPVTSAKPNPHHTSSIQMIFAQNHTTFLHPSLLLATSNFLSPTPLSSIFLHVRPLVHHGVTGLPSLSIPHPSAHTPFLPSVLIPLRSFIRFLLASSLPPSSSPLLL